MKKMKKHNYSGRIDSSRPERFHQIVEPYTNEANSDVIIGFMSDEGVRRNKGRIGAKEAPEKIREKLSSLAYTSPIFDAGSVEGTEDLETSQKILGKAVSELLSHNNFPVILGGGHETVYGHYLGVRDAYKDKRIAVLNIDAHFDLRNEEKSSGTMFYEMLSEDDNIDYFVIGIQPFSNTKSLYENAEKFNVKYWTLDELRNDSYLSAIKTALEDYDYVFMTLCMDSIQQSYAPGTSAPAPNGFTAEEIIKTVKYFASLENLSSFDISEVSPPLDIDDRTSSLAALIVITLLNERNSN
ncbi:MAG TPA: formimidoylglutamase [Candidatus Nosocomiicoccus stercorigallinarum]|nr:formimidoylglutamase [Candidatus Nosocomiicoccus stercorigallinarum]